jgi:NADPH2:quinone reductase
MEGRLVQIAAQRGAKTTIDLLRIMLKRLTHTGSTLRARSVEDKAAIARALEEHVLPLIARGTVHPLIDSTFPLAEAGRAHARMESGAHIGKIVLTLAID